MTNQIKIVFMLLLVICTNRGYASDTLSNPAAVLVQLRSENNRIQALTKARDKRLGTVIKDAVAIAQAMRLDFHDNFNYCPVYYYMDTNAERIRNKQFEGVLLDVNGVPVTDLVIDSRSTDYVIAYYGYPVSQSKLDRVQKDKKRYTADSDPPFGRGLVILDHRFLQLTYFYKVGLDEIGLSKKIDKKYYHRSKILDMEYYPFAGQFNVVMLDKYGPRRLTPRIKK